MNFKSEDFNKGINHKSIINQKSVFKNTNYVFNDYTFVPTSRVQDNIHNISKNQNSQTLFEDPF
jgi:hypothetical protein